jgi:hypothetical protein|tara:strand:+ start:2808 stop:3014 length:207 start_codon:yes stop_codon:yes gene_type:complete
MKDHETKAMSIKIDQRSERSVYVTAGNLTIYIEHSPCAQEFVHIWDRDDNDIHQSYLNADSKKREVDE